MDRGPGEDDLAAGIAFDGKGRERIPGVGLDDSLLCSRRLISDLVGQDAGGLRWGLALNCAIALASLVGPLPRAADSRYQAQAKADD